MSRQPPFCVRCKHHSIRPGFPEAFTPGASDYVCNAVFHVVTGEKLTWKCQDARGDQMICGREGKLFEMIEPA